MDAKLQKRGDELKERSRVAHAKADRLTADSWALRAKADLIMANSQWLSKEEVESCRHT